MKFEIDETMKPAICLGRHKRFKLDSNLGFDTTVCSSSAPNLWGSWLDKRFREQTWRAGALAACFDQAVLNDLTESV